MSRRRSKSRATRIRASTASSALSADAGDDTGFDIPGGSNDACFSTDGGFYSVNPGTGQATFVGHIAAAREPRSWGFMILGCGVAGAAPRRVPRGRVRDRITSPLATTTGRIRAVDRRPAALMVADGVQGVVPT